MRIRTLDTLARLAFLLLLAVSVACSGGSGDANVPQPPTYAYSMPLAMSDSWTTAHAADEGVDVARIEAMMNSVRAGRYPYIDAVVVARNGRLVLDETVRTIV